MAGIREPLVVREQFEDQMDFEPPAVASDLRPFVHHPEPRSPHLNQLARAIEREIVPRLVLAHRRTREPVGPVNPPPGLTPSEEVKELAHLTVDRDPAPAARFVEALHVGGAPAETLFVDLLTPTARHLGDLWVADLCTFGEVTVGLMRLQQAMRALSPSFQSEAAGPLPSAEHQILLSPVPGEQHSFGLFMVAEFFHRAGWQIWSGPVSSLDDLARAASGRWFAVAGFSVSSDAKLEMLSAAIRTVRRHSLNRSIAVMVGGHVFSTCPDLVARVGADVTAADGQQAVLQAQDLLALRAQHG